MSSSFLYLAIVAVWAFVLVPQWIRRQYARVQPSAEVEVDVEYAAEYDAGPEYYDDDVQDVRPGSHAPGSQEMHYMASGPPGASRPLGPGRSAAARAPQSRSRMLRARRRLLMMHLLLMAVAAACVVLKITSWLVMIPPTGMLGVYLLLLREAAVTDSEQARRRAAVRAQVWAAHERAYTVASEPEPEPSAQVIDISARVGDQLYDQYADATVRAVGD